MNFITSVLKIIVAFFVTMFIIILLIAWAWPSAEETQATINDLHTQTAEDFAQQYEQLHRSNASQMDLCVRAGFVTEAYLQADDPSSYEKWQTIEDGHCEKAGLHY